MIKLDINNPELVKPTDFTRKLTIDGETEAYQVFRIKLDCLYYNNQNDRIATWLSKYESDHGPLTVESPEYNDVIQEMTKESNPKAFEKTKKNIASYMQREPGVILQDGRIIDGNRRFTCLRELSKEDPKYGYFEAVILPHSYDSETGKKAIKALELTIQHGTDKQVDYDPINKLVGIYRDLIEDGHAFTIKEYARYIDQKESEVQKYVEVANLMVDYLDFIGAPKQFYIAVEHNINGPLNEMQTILKKFQDEELHEDMKQAMFGTILYLDGDITREVRKYRKSADAGITREFHDEQNKLVDRISEKIGDIDEPITPTVISEKIVNDKELKADISESLDQEFERVSNANARSAPLNLVKQALMKVQAIDRADAKIADHKDELLERLNELEEQVAKLKEYLNE